MKIFVSHSRGFDFEKELYGPLKNSSLAKDHEIILPHDQGGDQNTKETIKNSSVVLAEVSYPSTGQGIELGWAEIFGTPIVCIYKEGSKISRSLSKITDKFISYKDSGEMITKLQETL